MLRRLLTAVLTMMMLDHPVAAGAEIPPPALSAPLGTIVDPFLDGSGAAPAVVALPEITFTMGGRPRDPGWHVMQVPHRVTVSPFAIGRSEVTNAEYCLFLNDPRTRATMDARWLLMVELPELCRIEERDGRWMPRPGTARQPVVTVTWYGARAYCHWLSEKTGRSYELPTAAQWEAAARAGSTATFPWGSEWDANLARTCRSGIEGLADAESYPPNAWGIHEMIGNVWEWVLDCFELGFYHFSPSRDPLMLDDRCGAPEIRGGSWADDVAQTRPAFRTNFPWSGITDRIGFRIARAFGDDDERRLR
jgi:formylglycine-generating enzyme required for sulfatase activity